MMAMPARPRSTRFALVAPCLRWLRMRIVSSCRGKPTKAWRETSPLMWAVIGKSTFVGSRDNSRLQPLNLKPSNVSSTKNSQFYSTLNQVAPATLPSGVR